MKVNIIVIDDDEVTSREIKGIIENSSNEDYSFNVNCHGFEEGIKELKAENESLKARIELLEAKQ